ncbi:hypothetical protein APT63_04520 [Pseudomonas sp. 22-AL-CL-001]|nr:hypothetical protein APT63_04520 [Pseudomonas monteilii]
MPIRVLTVHRVGRTIQVAIQTATIERTRGIWSQKTHQVWTVETITLPQGICLDERFVTLAVESLVGCPIKGAMTVGAVGSANEPGLAAGIQH